MGKSNFAILSGGSLDLSYIPCTRKIYKWVVAVLA